MIELDLTNVKETEYKNFKVGKNKCYINGVLLKKSQAGNNMLEVRMRDAEGATLTDKLVLTEKAMWRVKQFLKACQLPHSGKVNIDEKQLLSRHLIVDCVAEAYTKQDGTEGTAIKVKQYIEDPSFSFGDDAPKEEIKEDDIPL
jgi:hypothetical protein